MGYFVKDILPLAVGLSTKKAALQGPLFLPGFP
jgi:hypothetical protein